MSLALPHCVFIDIPKCGCTSVFRALNRYPEGNWHQRTIPDESLPLVAVVRNPFSRALSLYHFERYQCARDEKKWWPGGTAGFWKQWGMDTFDQFLGKLIDNVTLNHKQWPNVLPCALFLAPLEPVHILRLETLQADWDACEFLPSVTIPHERRQSYDRTLTARQADLIREWAIEDFTEYGYDPETHPTAA